MKFVFLYDNIVLHMDHMGVCFIFKQYFKHGFIDYVVTGLHC